MTQRPAFFPLQGGLNLVTPAIRTPSGHAIAAKNYEPVERGYARIDGYERYDGRPKPSEASYWVLEVDPLIDAVAEGETVTGLASGATGTAIIGGVAESTESINEPVEFDGSTWLDRRGGLTGAADDNQGICVFWINLAANPQGVIRTVLASANGRVRVLFDVGLSENEMQLYVRLQSSGGSVYQMISSTYYGVASGWKCFLLSWDTNATAGNKIGHMYEADTDIKGTVTDASAAFDVDYTDTDWHVGYDGDGFSPLGGCLARLYFAPGQFLDFSVEANRRKFIDASGQPVSLGSDGSTPTGSAPLVYLRRPGAAFGVNAGTGGDFTVTAGELTVCGSAPTGMAAVNVSSGYLVLTNVSGTFVSGEYLAVSSAVKAIAGGAASERAAENDDDDTTWHRAAIEAARDAIGQVTGSGRIRGLWWYDGALYAFRNDGINAVTFETTDYLTRGGGLTGAVDGSDLLVSLWIKPSRLDAGRIIAASADQVVIDFDAIGGTGKLRVRLHGSPSSNFFTFETILPITADEWHHVLICADTNQAAGAKVAQMYVDDISNCVVTSDEDAAFNIDFTPTDWTISASGGTLSYAGSIAELWFGPGQSLDLSVEANRRKFISASGEAVDLGSDGSTPTGVAPLIYLKGAASSYGTNSGSGGNFTVIGTLADADPPPFEGTECRMWKATTSGWSQVDLGRSLSFSSGGTYEIEEGDEITGATSGAKATVGRVIVTSGDWGSGTAAGRLILTEQTGTFQAENLDVDANSNVATIAGDSSAQTLPPGGRYEFVNHNFFGASDLRRMYGVNGVGTAFEFDGEVFVPILTGMTDDKPTHIAVYKNHLFLSFPGGSIQNSGTGEPYDWSPITGAAEIGLGEDVTGFGLDVSGGLVIAGRSKIALLYGNDISDFVLQTITEDSGAIEWTMQKLGQLMFMDDRGVRDMRTTQLFGNFKIGTITRMVEPLIAAKKKAGVLPINSCRVRKKDQYRLFFDDGTGITIYLGRKDPEILPFDLGKVVYAVASCECQTLGEVMFFGSDDGYVYELDAGTSFDGEAIPAYIRLAFNHVGSPTHNKRWHKITLEVDAAPTTTLGLTAEFSYADPDQPPAPELSFTVAGGGGFWDEDNWDQFYWSSPVEGLAECPIDGMGTNLSIAVISNAIYEEPHVIHGLTLHYSLRGLKR